MKKIYFLLFALGCGQMFAQQTANLVLFAEMGEPFYVYVNSVKQNETASSNVKIIDLTHEYVHVRVEFEDAAIQPFDKNLMLVMGYEIIGQLRQNNKGKYVIRPYGEPVPLAAAPERTDDQPVIIYHEEPVVMEMEHRPAPVDHQPETVTTVIETETYDNSNPGGAKVDVDMDGIGIQMDVVITDPTLDGSTKTHVTHTTTTTTTTTTTQLPIQHMVMEDPVNIQEPVYIEEVVHEPLVPGYNGPVGCGDYLLSEQPFQAAKASINSKSFEDDKITVAKQVSRSQCLTANQVKEIMALFTFEASKLDWAKYAYDRTYDIGNYWMLNDGFTFSSSIDELDEYIQSRR